MQCSLTFHLGSHYRLLFPAESYIGDLRPLADPILESLARLGLAAEHYEHIAPIPPIKRQQIHPEYAHIYL